MILYAFIMYCRILSNTLDNNDVALILGSFRCECMITYVWDYTASELSNYVQLTLNDPHALCHCPCAGKAVVIKRVGYVGLNFNVRPVSNSRIEITFIFATSGLKLVSFTIGSDRSFALADASPTLHVKCLHALVLIWLCHVASTLIPFYSILIMWHDKYIAHLQKRLDEDGWNQGGAVHQKWPLFHSQHKSGCCFPFQRGFS